MIYIILGLVLTINAVGVYAIFKARKAISLGIYTPIFHVKDEALRKELTDLENKDFK